MAGTRVILANYLRTIGLTPLEIKTVLLVLIEHPEYPNLPLLRSCFADLGLNLLVTDVGLADLFPGTTPVISSVNAAQSYIILLGAKNRQIYYLDAGGSLNTETEEKFAEIWDKKVYLITASVSLENVRSVLRGKVLARQFAPNYHPTLQQIKNAGLGNEPYVYRFCRLFSIYLTYCFARLRIHPNLITGSWVIPIVCAGISFSAGFSLLNRWLAVGLILLGLTLDCSDGETARLTGKSSSLGGYLDGLIHWVSTPILTIGIIFGELHTHSTLSIITEGMLCITSGTTYNFVVQQSNTWKGQDNPYAQFDSLFNPLFYLYPLDINIFLFGAILNSIPIALRIWLYLSLVLITLLITKFIWQEIKHARK
jgi:phosphatidylglycerophosphate synthase